MKWVYIFVIINHFQKLYYSCLTHIILETLCCWLIAQECYLHTLLNTSFHTQPLDIHFLSKQRSHFYEIQNCSHFPVLLMLAHFVITWYLVYVIIKDACYKMLHLFMLGHFLPPFCFLPNY